RHPGGGRRAARTSRATDLVRGRRGRVSGKSQGAGAGLSRYIRRALSRDGAGPGRAPRGTSGARRDRGDGGRAALKGSLVQRIQTSISRGCGPQQTLFAFWAEEIQIGVGALSLQLGGQRMRVGIIVQLPE